MKARVYGVAALATLLTAGACGNGSTTEPDDSSGPQQSGVPSWLMDAWIFQLSPGNATVWDFRQNGSYCSSRSCVMSAQNWLYQGTLGGWQRLGAPYPLSFWVSGNTVRTTSTVSGTTTDYTVQARTSTQMTLYNTRTGSTVTLYNCAADVWPALIAASTAGCR